MNDLEKYLLSKRISPVEAMNRLQDFGIVSDNAVWPADVADVDCERAIKFLQENPCPA